MKDTIDMTSDKALKADGVALYKRRELDGAVAAFTAALAVAPRAALPRLLANRAAAHLESCHLQRTVVDSKLALEALAADGEEGADDAAALRVRLTSRCARAEMRLASGRSDAARACELYAAARYPAAVEAFGVAIASCDRGDGEVVSALHSGRSQALAKLGAFERALRDAEAALQRCPSRSAALMERVAKLRSAVASRRGLARERGGCSRGWGCEAAVTPEEIAPASTSTPRMTHVLVSVARAVEVDVREVFIHSTGGRLWHGALALASWLIDGVGREQVLVPRLIDTTARDGQVGGLHRGGRLLEVGAGVGLVGLAAAAAGVKRVMLSDIDVEVLASLRIAVAAARYADVRVSVMALDYGRPTAPQLGLAANLGSLGDSASDARPSPEFAATQFDVIVGSEVIYKGQEHAHLARALAELLAPDGVAILCLSDGRLGIVEFVACCAAAGLECEVEPLRGEAMERMRTDTEEPDLCVSRPVSLYKVRHTVVASE